MPDPATQARIAVVGSGAVGVYYGGRLAQHGHDVHFLVRGDYDHVRRHGWTVRSCDGDFTLSPDRVRVYRDPGEMPKADFVLVTLKATANDALDDLVRPLVHDGTVILTLQNGLGNEERLAESFGAPRVLGGVAFVCINRTGPGAIDHLSEGAIRIGEFATRGLTDRLRTVERWFNAARVPCEAIPDLPRARWQKLVWNIPFNGLGALLDVTTDKLVFQPDAEQLVREVMAEVIAAARGVGVDMPEPGPLIDHQIRITRAIGAYKTSMQIDRHRGRDLEIEAILGEPLRRARQAGVAVPRLEMMYRMMRAICGPYEPV
jgi:2-dehydropantoate 2-reductase